MLSIGASAHGALIVLTWTNGWVYYIPATTAIIPSLLLATIGITTTVLGLVVKGRASFNRVGVLMISGFFLGVFGLLSWFQANNDNYHVADVCLVSTLYPDGAEWACPQVQASSQITWILAISLAIPALLFLVAPFLTSPRAQPKGGEPSTVSIDPQK